MKTDSHRIYRLDGIEIDTSRVCLKRNNQEQHLRQKTFHVLTYLLEHRERVVPKNELIDQVWEGAAVTDNVLEQCLAQIRRVLGDDSRNPRFVKTIPKAGYRFIGTVEEIRVLDYATPGQPSGVVEQTVKNIDLNAPATAQGKTATQSSRVAFAIFGFVLLIAIVGAGFYFIRRRASLPPLAVTLPEAPGKRPVAVMFFDNESGNTDLDWLREGLADMIITDLSRSKNVAVLSRQQLHELLDRMGHRDADKIRLDEALQVAQESHAKIVLLGSFARLGDQISIDVKLHDARDGQLLTAERLVVDGPTHILNQVDVLSLKLASHLGATPEIDVQSGLTSVMTNNLAAYRYYSLGVEKAQEMQNKEAVDLFEKAIALDGDFAMAHARVGYIYAVSWGISPEKAKPYLAKAFQLSRRLTEKDKLYITGWYAIANLDYATAIKSFQEIIQRFPMEIEAYRRLGGLLKGEERFDEAIDILKQGLLIDSGSTDLYNALGAIYSVRGQHDEAIAMYQRYIQLAPNEPNAHDSLAMGYQWAGKYDEAIAEYRRALDLKPTFDIALFHLANVSFQQGRYSDAIKQYQQYIQNAPSRFEKMRGYSATAYVELKRGKTDAAEQTGKAAARNDASARDVLFLIALEKNDVALAAKLMGEMEQPTLSDRGNRVSQRPALYYAGLLDLKRGRTTEAINEFKNALSHPPQTWNTDAFEDCLANAYLATGRVDEAISEYDRILKLNPNYPLVHYHLAQAYALKGETNRAHDEYQRFLQVWQDADGVPEVIKARALLGT
jgi:tetratricopeptide (TPR) repeat protein/DNA-binding winged helix-turn-helix (wHTH) protein